VKFTFESVVVASSDSRSASGLSGFDGRNHDCALPRGSTMRCPQFRGDGAASAVVTTAEPAASAIATVRASGPA
jgi:hypothetical protein